MVSPVLQWQILSETGDVQGTLKITCRNPDLNGSNFVDQYPNGFEIRYGGSDASAYSAARETGVSSGVDKYEILVKSLILVGSYEHALEVIEEGLHLCNRPIELFFLKALKIFYSCCSK